MSRDMMWKFGYMSNNKIVIMVIIWYYIFFSGIHRIESFNSKSDSVSRYLTTMLSKKILCITRIFIIDRNSYINKVYWRKLEKNK